MKRHPSDAAVFLCVKMYQKETHFQSTPLRTSLLYTNMKRFVDLEVSEWQTLSAFIRENQISKKTVVLRQGESCRKFYFVERGSLRAFQTNADGKESTVMFAVEDWWITDMAAFMDKRTADISIEALENCVLFEIESTSMNKMLQSLPKLEKYFRILFQRAYVREQQRVLQAISNTVEERYLGFLHKYPKIAEKISQRHIASYLGVTPEFLSTIKNNIRS
mgnify:FL=1